MNTLITKLANRHFTKEVKRPTKTGSHFLRTQVKIATEDWDLWSHEPGETFLPQLVSSLVLSLCWEEGAYKAKSSLCPGDRAIPCTDKALWATTESQEDLRLWWESPEADSGKEQEGKESPDLESHPVRQPLTWLCLAQATYLLWLFIL